MGAVRDRRNALKTRAIRAARQLASPPQPQKSEDIVVHADAAGAAHIMREIVALHDLSIPLEEHDGHWQVVVRPGRDPKPALAKIIEVTARCVEKGCVDFATLCVGKRTYTIHEARALDVPVAAA
jgi:hypothetical protein